MSFQVFYLTPNMNVTLAESSARAFFNIQLPANVMNRVYAIQHGHPSDSSLSKTITVSLASHSAFTAVQDFFVVDDLNVDIVMGRGWLEVCSRSASMSKAVIHIRPHLIQRR